MASKSRKLILKKHVDGGGEKQDLITPDENPIHENYEGTGSDSDSEEEERTPMVSPEKPKLTPTRRGLVPEPGRDGSECSSPSPSGFIIMPASKPLAKKAPSTPKKFSPEVEIALLKGLADFWVNGRNNKWAEFHAFVKDDLPLQLTKIQVSEKIRGLKRKFDTNLERARANGGQLDFSDDHESLLFELSKRLWGEDSGTICETGRKAKNRDDEEKEKKTSLQREENKTLVKREKSIAPKTIKNGGNSNDGERNKQQKRTISIDEFAAEYPLLCASFDAFGYPNFAKDFCTLIGKEKAQELEDKWRELNTEKLQLEVKRIDLIKRDLLDNHTSK